MLPQNEQLFRSEVRSTSQPFAGFLSQLPVVGGEQGFSTQAPSMHTAPGIGPAEQSVPHAPQFSGSFCRLVSQPSLGAVLQSFHPESQAPMSQPSGSEHLAWAWGSTQGAHAVEPLHPLAGSFASSHTNSPVVSGQALAPGKQVPVLMTWPPSLPPLAVPASGRLAPVCSMLHARAAVKAAIRQAKIAEQRRIHERVPVSAMSRKAGAFCRDCGRRSVELSLPRRARRGWEPPLVN